MTTHYDSFRVNPDLDRPRSLTIVDDVVTRGDTLLAAASRVKEGYPDAEFRVFAVVRTMGFVTDIDRIVDPAVGALVLVPGGRVQRRP